MDRYQLDDQTMGTAAVMYVVRSGFLSAARRSPLPFGFPRRVYSGSVDAAGTRIQCFSAIYEYRFCYFYLQYHTKDRPLLLVIVAACSDVHVVFLKSCVVFIDRASQGLDYS